MAGLRSEKTLAFWFIPALLVCVLVLSGLCLFPSGAKPVAIRAGCASRSGSAWTEHSRNFARELNSVGRMP